MAFAEVLKGLVDGIDGAMGAALMGMDGISVHHYVDGKTPCDVEAVGIEYGKVVEEVKNASRILKLGALEELSVSSDDKEIILRMATEDYYVALVLSGAANTGRARYLLKRAASKLKKEL